MRILVLCEGDAETHDSWSGTSRSVVMGLRALGHEIICRDVDLYGADRWLGAGLTFSPRRRRWWVKYHLGSQVFELRSRRARRFVERHAAEVDAVLQFGATFDARGAADLPYYLYCDSNIVLAERGRASGFGEAAQLSPSEIEGIRQREAAVYGGAAIIFTFSDYLRSSFEADFGVQPARLRTVYGGANLDLERIESTGHPKAGVPTILFVGRAFERKGGDVLLDAFSMVRANLADAELLVVGPAELRVSQPGVRLQGFLNKDEPGDWARLQELYAAAHVFALPTRFEPFGVSYVEAMAFGLPCIGSAVWAVPEIIADGETGFVVPVNDAVTIADRLLKLLTDPEHARQMGHAGRQRMERHFTWSAVAEKMARSMEEVLRGLSVNA